MEIPNANIFEIVKDTAVFIIAIKYELIYGLSIGIFTFDVEQLEMSRSGHSQHFDSKWFGNGKRYGKHYNCC